MKKHRDDLLDRARELAASGRLDDLDAMTVRALVNKCESLRSACRSITQLYARHLRAEHDNT